MYPPWPNDNKTTRVSLPPTRRPKFGGGEKTRKSACATAELDLPPGMEGFPLSAGWGTFGKARLFVSRGVGNTGFALRLNCPPELALHTLRPA